MDNAQPLVKALKSHQDYSLHARSRLKTKLEALAAVADRRRRPAQTLIWRSQPAVGFSLAYEVNGFALSWPCGCVEWRASEVVVSTAEGDAVSPPCRHVASIDHLLKHWQVAGRLANVKKRWPKSVERVDTAMNPAAGEVPQVHFLDGSALNIDGCWKHSRRTLTAAEEAWLASVGWVLPTHR